MQMQHIKRRTPGVQTVRAVLTLHKRSIQQPQQLHKSAAQLPCNTCSDLCYSGEHTRHWQVVVEGGEYSCLANGSSRNALSPLLCNCCGARSCNLVKPTSFSDPDGALQPSILDMML